MPQLIAMKKVIKLTNASARDRLFPMQVSCFVHRTMWSVKLTLSQ